MKKRIFKPIIFIFISIIIISLSKFAYNINKLDNLAKSRAGIIQYFVTNIDKYKREFEKMGYESKIEYKEGNEYNSDYEILILSNKSRSFTFYRGLESINIKVGNNSYVNLSKSWRNSNNNLPLYYDDNSYRVEVTLLSPAYQGEHQYDPYNEYKINFEDFLIIWDGEMEDDYKIKKYISAQELRKLLNDGKELEDNLVKLYDERNKWSFIKNLFL